MPQFLQLTGQNGSICIFLDSQNGINIHPNIWTNDLLTFQDISVVKQII